MPVNSYPAGIQSSATGGHETVTSTPVYTDRRVLYVDSNHPNADDANPGTEREAPFLSLAGTNLAGTGGGDGLYSGAYYNALADDIIIVAASHTEIATHAVHGAAGNPTLKCSISVTKAGLSIIGLGSGTTRPTLSSQNGTPIFTVTGTGFELRNFQLRVGSVETDPTTLVDINVAGCVIGECDFEVSTPCTSLLRAGNAAVSTGLKVESCTFTNSRTVASGTHGGSPPLVPRYGIYCPGTFSVSSLYIESCTFSGGTTGWDDGAIHLASPTNLRIYNCTFSNGADIEATAFRGILSNNTMAASCRIINDRLRGYPLGLVASTDGGHAILSNPNLYITGSVYWVDSSDALASNSNNGTERDHPLATLAQAITNHTAANGDLIIVESGHSQLLMSSTTTISEADTKIFGLGTSSAQKPGFTPATTVTPLFTLSGNGVELHGLRFPASAVATTTIRISVTGEQCVIEGCDFTMNANYDIAAVDLVSGDGSEVNNCTFTIATVPALDNSSGIHAIQLAHTAQLYNLVDNCTFDGGSAALGFNGGALYFNSAAQRTVVLGCTFRYGADIYIPNGETNIVIAGNTMDATSRVDWTI